MKRYTAIRKWTQSVHWSFPDGCVQEKCVKRLDLENNFSKIHIGHIISHHWVQTYSFFNQSPRNRITIYIQSNMETIRSLPII